MKEVTVKLDATKWATLLFCVLKKQIENPDSEVNSRKEAVILYEEILTQVSERLNND